MRGVEPPRGSAISDQISSNRRRSVALLATFVGLVLLLTLAVNALVGAGFVALLVALVVAVGVAVAAYLFSDRIALGMTRAQIADANRYPRYHNLVEGLCVAAGLPKPDLYVIDDPAPNAFATGRNPDHSAVVVTTGLLDKLSRVELEGVLAHELSHIRSYDTLVAGIAVTVVGMFGAVVVPLAPLAAKLIRVAVQPRRELLADVGGVRLTRYPPGLVSALEKLRSEETVVRSGSRATAHLWIESPLERHEGRKGARLNRLFDSHPPIEQRIKDLKEL